MCAPAKRFLAGSIPALASQLKGVAIPGLNKALGWDPLLEGGVQWWATGFEHQAMT
jgi:hypothetical protein